MEEDNLALLADSPWAVVAAVEDSCCKGKGDSEVVEEDSRLAVAVEEGIHLVVVGDIHLWYIQCQENSLLL